MYWTPEIPTESDPSNLCQPRTLWDEPIRAVFLRSNSCLHEPSISFLKLATCCWPKAIRKKRGSSLGEYPWPLHAPWNGDHAGYFPILDMFLWWIKMLIDMLNDILDMSQGYPYSWHHFFSNSCHLASYIHINPPNSSSKQAKPFNLWRGLHGPTWPLISMYDCKKKWVCIYYEYNIIHRDCLLLEIYMIPNGWVITMDTMHLLHESSIGALVVAAIIAAEWLGDLISRCGKRWFLGSATTICYRLV